MLDSVNSVTVLYTDTNLCPCFQKTIYGANVVIFEGIMCFVNKDLREVRKSIVCGQEWEILN